MRRAGRVAVGGALIAATLTGPAAAVPYAQQSAARRALDVVGAVAANVTPLSTLYAPRCLPGYILCKAMFASFSLIAAADQLMFSGGTDLDQTDAILYRGFAGDWIITPRHIAGDAEPQPLPDPPPPKEGTPAPAWTPPPL